jgi:hypothetical protein
MKEIIVHNQKALDEAVKEKDCYIIIRDTTEYLSVYDNATIQSVSGNATIQYVSGNATIKSVSGNATIKSVSDNATIKSVSGNATIQYVSDKATIKSVSDNATIKYVYDNATIQYVYGNATIKIFNNSVFLESVCMFAVIIMIGCVCKIKKKQKSVTVIKNEVARYTTKDFLAIYGSDDDGNLTLYKSVHPKTNCDFYTGKIKYEGTVTCPDWNPDNSIECGEGLHLSPLPEMALSYNDGKLLVCKVHKKDFVVYPENITKVRCKKVTVVGEYKKGKK